MIDAYLQYALKNRSNVVTPLSMRNNERLGVAAVLLLLCIRS